MSDPFLKIPRLLFLSPFSLRALLHQCASSKSCFQEKQSAAFQYYRLLQNHVFISQKEAPPPFFFSHALQFRGYILPKPRTEKQLNKVWKELTSVLLL